VVSRLRHGIQNDSVICRLFVPLSYMQISLAAVSLRQRDKQTANDGIVLNAVPVPAHDADYFHIVRRAVLRRLCVADMLTDRVLVREKFFCHFFVNERYTAPLFVFAFLLSEITAPQEFYAQRVAVTGRDRGVE